MSKVATLSLQANTDRQDLAGNDNRKGDLVLLTALAGGASIKDAAKVAGIGERTAHRRLEDPAFQRRITELRSEFLSSAIRRLSESTTEAADTMRSLLQSKSDSVRLSAARSILEFASKLGELAELNKRLAELEERVLEQHESQK